MSVRCAEHDCEFRYEPSLYMLVCPAGGERAGWATDEFTYRALLADRARTS